MDVPNTETDSEGRSVMFELSLADVGQIVCATHGPHSVRVRVLGSGRIRVELRGMQGEYRHDPALMAQEGPDGDPEMEPEVHATGNEDAVRREYYSALRGGSSEGGPVESVAVDSAAGDGSGRQGERIAGVSEGGGHDRSHGNAGITRRGEGDQADASQLALDLLLLADDLLRDGVHGNAPAHRNAVGRSVGNIYIYIYIYIHICISVYM